MNNKNQKKFSESKKFWHICQASCFSGENTWSNIDLHFQLSSCAYIRCRCIDLPKTLHQFLIEEKELERSATDIDKTPEK